MTTAFHLQKGGVGKTSLSGTVATECSQKAKTILLDCDPQGNASSWLALHAPRWELASVLLGKVEIPEAITPSVVTGLDLLPTFGLDGELKLYGESQLSNEPFIFCDLIDELKTLGYEYVILDLSPGMGRLERAVLISADEVITPMTPEAFSLDGIEIFRAELEKTSKAMRRGPQHKKIVINAFDERIGQHIAIADNARKGLSNFELFTIPVDPAFRKAQASHLALQALQKKDAAKAVTLAEIRRIGDAICH